MFVDISRAKISVAVDTDDRAKLVSEIMERAGEKQVVMEALTGGLRKSNSTAAGLG
jgi:hypothetical protein